MIILSAILFLGVGVAAQEPTPTPSPTPVSPTEELTLLLREIDDLKRDVRRLDATTEKAQGVFQRILQARTDRKWLGIIERTRKAADDVLAVEQQGQAVPAERERVTELLREIPVAIYKSVAANRRLISSTDPHGQALPPVEESGLLAESDRIMTRIVSLYEALEHDLGLMVRYGLDAAGERTRLANALDEGAETVSVYLELATDDAKEIVERLRVLPDDADLKARLSLARARIRTVAGWLQSMVKVMDRLALDTAEYRQQLVTSTGEIGADILDVHVVRQLTDRAYKNAKKWVADNAPNALAKMVVVVLVLLAAWALGRVASRLTRRALASRAGVSQLLRDFLVTMVRRLFLLLGLVVALTHFGFPIGPTLAGLGVAGFIVGFALQDTLSNFAAGMMILVYRPFDVGDVVEAGGVLGKVHGMSLVSTSILTFDNQKMIVPNNKIWGDVIKNITAETIRRVDLTFGISYGDDIAKAEAILREVVTGHTKVLADPEPMIKVHQLGDSSVQFIVRPWTNSADYWDVYWDLIRAVKLRFDREGITFPFPQREVRVVHETAPQK